MPVFLTLPDWLPPWMQIVVTAAIVLIGLMFAAMPFSVFGVKGRLDIIEARLDEIQNEIRALSLRLPESEGRPPIPPAGPRTAARREPRLS